MFLFHFKVVLPLLLEFLFAFFPVTWIWSFIFPSIFPDFIVEVEGHVPVLLFFIQFHSSPLVPLFVTQMFIISALPFDCHGFFSLSFDLLPHALLLGAGMVKGHWTQSSYLPLTFLGGCKMGDKSSPCMCPAETWRLENRLRNWDNLLFNSE